MLLTHPTSADVFIIRTQTPTIVGKVIIGANNDVGVAYFDTLDEAYFDDYFLEKQLKKFKNFYLKQIKL